jgi:DNA invertase Pin-like site-specific DNA recombinase
MDNVNDKVRKGRGFRLPPASEHADKMPRGSQHWNAKLNDDVVKEIKRRSNGGARQGEIARAMGLTRTTVQRIVSRTTWKHVEP